ncbi:hypothetical protein MtrunA17_Chr8g0374691 [Medicago truncatula]|uniref:Uncharacterized protein n=1 Tax=Medicago truncatula TaxID=3880 RepID=A0A396GPA7_MEDTR|nr:hypothetical protein MtrunA17_Chr8g0374691 [Medicago truncatula]
MPKPHKSSFYCFFYYRCYPNSLSHVITLLPRKFTLKSWFIWYLLVFPFLRS